LAARVYDEVFGYIEDATKTLPGAAAPGELLKFPMTGDVLANHQI